ncbi:MAG TPA: hypothetical protein VGR78_10970 [Verrucomicrobiae bacterium]|nr:hypothetical protein [Verrucomicrobiae bacterium]
MALLIGISRALTQKSKAYPLAVLAAAVALIPSTAAAGVTTAAAKPKITNIDPPEKGFFSKQLDFHGIPIKAHQIVADEALYAAYDRLSLLFTHLLARQPMVLSNLIASGAELHIIGRDQVTTDLPEWRHDKGKPIPMYNGLTRDQRTRGMGGLLTSCGEENLLGLEQDRYRGRDICLHEFSHNVLNHGCPPEIKALFAAQRTNSLAEGLWQKSYAGSNVDEFFAELTMWYFETHGDLHMTGVKPENGREGLKKYDPEAFKIMDDLYSGRIDIREVAPRRRSDASPVTPSTALLDRCHLAPFSAKGIGPRTASLPWLTSSFPSSRADCFASFECAKTPKRSVFFDSSNGVC